MTYSKDSSTQNKRKPFSDRRKSSAGKPPRDAKRANQQSDKPRYPKREEAPITARLVALRMLRRILDKGQSFDQAQQQIGEELNRLEERDRAFARAIVLNCLRRKGQIDALIDHYLEKPVQGDQGIVAHLLRVGMVQLLFMDTPAHAVVSELLSLLDKKSEFSVARKFKGLVNAILGRADREGKADIASQNAARLNLPEWLWTAWIKDYGEETAEKMAAANLIEAPIDVMPRDFSKNVNLDDAITLPGHGQRLPAGYPMAKVAGFKDGDWWVQDIASSLPLIIAEKIMGGFKDKSVIDLCAAPGGKTMQLAAAGASVTAVDLSKQRLKRLEENLKRINLDADVVVSDVLKWQTDQKADVVLLDAPCSATGTMRRHPDLAHIKSQEDVNKLASAQGRLLTRAWDLVKPGGYLIYAVCSLQKSEAEGQFNRFVKSLDDGKKVAIANDVVPGLEDCVTEDGLLRCRPDILSDIGGMDGFFAGFIKKDE